MRSRQVERRPRPVKVRRRGLSPGQLVVALSECQLVGGQFFSDLEEVRADEAGSGLRMVGATPSAPTALQGAKDFRRVPASGSSARARGWESIWIARSGASGPGR